VAHTDADVRRRAIALLAKIGDSRIVDSLIPRLWDENTSVRKSAAQALGKIRDAKAVGPLIRALKDRDSGVRGCAAEALGEIGHKGAIEPLTRILEDEDEDDEVWQRAADALAKINRAVEAEGAASPDTRRRRGGR